MIKKILWAIPVILFLVACHKKVSEKMTTEVKSEKEFETPKTTPTTPTQAPIFIDKPVEHIVIPEGIDSNLLVSFQRTPCFGHCPVFKVEIYKDGKARYEGKAFARRMNAFETTVSEDFIKKIQLQARTFKYFELANNYPQGENQVVDLPHIITYIRANNIGKRINNVYDAPKELIEFERWIENELDNLDWKEVK